MSNDQHASAEKAEGDEAFFSVSIPVIRKREGWSAKDLFAIDEVDRVLRNVPLTLFFVPFESHARIPDVATFVVTKIDCKVSSKSLSFGLSADAILGI